MLRGIRYKNKEDMIEQLTRGLKAQGMSEEAAKHAAEKNAERYIKNNSRGNRPLFGDDEVAAAKAKEGENVDESENKENKKEEDEPDYESMTVEELREKVAEREIEIAEGSGANGAVIKADLVEALQADDEEEE